MNGSKPDDLGASAARQVEISRAAPCGAHFPLTPALSPGERVSHSLRGEQSMPLGLPLRDARCSLSLGERVRVRGNNATALSGVGPIPGTVELDEFSDKAVGYP